MRFCNLPQLRGWAPRKVDRERGEERKEGRGEGREGRWDGKGGKGRGERRGREGVDNLRKTTPRHQMAGYGPACIIKTN